MHKTDADIINEIISDKDTNPNTPRVRVKTRNKRKVMREIKKIF